PYAQIVDLARRSTSRSRFMGDVMRCAARCFSSPYAAIHLRYAAEVVQDDWHTGSTDPRFWKSGLQEFLTESLTQPRSRAKLLRSRTGRTTAAFLSTPVFDPTGSSVGAIALVVTNVSESEVTQKLTALEALCRLASYAAAFVGRDVGQGRAGRLPDQAMVRAAKSESVEELAFAITNEMRNKLGCEMVVLGLVRARRVRIISISGLDQVSPRSPGVASIRAAMEECLDAQKAIAYPPPEDDSGSAGDADYHIHKQWHGVAKGDAVASIPLCMDGEPAAILSLRQHGDQAISAKTLEDIRSKVEPFVPALMLSQRAGRSLVRHLRDSVARGASSLVRPGHVGRKIFAMVFAACAAWFCFGSTTYELTLPCTVTPASMRHTAAPFQGVLSAVHVIEGDIVKAGDVLCVFDTRDIAQERSQLVAELKVLDREVDRGMATDSPVEVRLAVSKQEWIKSKLGIVDRRLERARVRTPIDGVIVAGDLRTRVGSVLVQGEPLMTVAPMEEWLLELEVPQSAIADVVAAANNASVVSGVFSSYARPDRRRSFQLDRLLPTTRPVKDHTVYIAEARIDARSDGLQPGMEGIARIDIGRRRVWWVWLHGMVDYLRINLWL
ncbi:MAG: efflux RND transporter periplasmic adaptor subunit, partial [Planctomycetes bacterium]|nr:efflux RND transporter periplasmic adaptor subunit [Planctomycetota bacterium]